MLYNTEPVLLKGWISLSYKSYINEAPGFINLATLYFPSGDFAIFYIYI